MKKNIFLSELVVLAFLFYIFLIIVTSNTSLNWNGTKWNEFPRVDLLALFMAAWIFRISTEDKLFRYSALTTLATAVTLSPSGLISVLLFVWFLIVFIYIFKKNKNYFLSSLEKIRTLFPFFLLLYIYPIVPMILYSKSNGQIHDYDTQLLNLDLILFNGHNPHLILETIFPKWSLEVLAFSYTSYTLLTAIIVMYLFIFKENEEIHELIFMLCLSLAIGYMGYFYVPAIGPLYSLSFHSPLDLNLMKPIKEALMDHTRIPRDCFPSLHTAITLIVCYEIKKYGNKLMNLILQPIGLLVPIACVALRYHYIVDVIFGALLAILIILLYEKYLKKKLSIKFSE